MSRVNQVLLVSLLAVCAGTGLANPQTTRGAAITVTATLLSTEADRLSFNLVLETHSVDLMQFDLTKLALVRTSDGLTAREELSWAAESESSHHRSGVLQVRARLDDTPFITAKTEYLELELKGVGVPSRIFRWAGESLPHSQRMPQAEYAYVPAVADGIIAAINLENNELEWTLQVSKGTDERPPESAMGIATSLDGRYVYTGDAVTKELVVVDAEKREVTAKILLPHGIHAIDLSPDGRYLWVDGGLEEYAWLSATSVIDTVTLEIVRALSPGLGSAAHLTFTSDSREVWAPSVTTNVVWVWDANTSEVLTVIPLTQVPLAGESPEGNKGLIGFNEVAISPDGTRAYAVGPEASTVYAIDVASREVSGTVQVGERAHGIAVTVDGAEIWIANRGGSVTIIDALSLEVLEALDMGTYANHVSFTLDGRFAYVSRQDDVVVVDVASREIVKEIAIGSEPHEFSLKGSVQRSGDAGG